MALAVTAEAAQAQRANDNAVTEAEDAFGVSVGLESIGLYSPSQVRVGDKPLNQSASTLRTNIEYRPDFLPSFSFDGSVSYFGERAASRDNVVTLPAYTLVDLGLRYRFKIGPSPATLRLQVQNLANTFHYDVAGSNAYELTDRRRASIYVAADF